MAAVILDLFAGPGGWSEGLRELGLSDFGIEWDEDCAATRYAAGHATLVADLAELSPLSFPGLPGRHGLTVEGLIASPPCQAFSVAGKSKGLADERGQLVWVPMHWALILRPRWVALEQVPTVLPIWKHVARVLEDAGYWTWTGVVNAADFGVPQGRERAVLLAHRERVVVPPDPTHAKDEQPEGMFGVARKRWITMAEALGWGLTMAPAGTVCANSGRPGGSSPLDGGSGARERYFEAMRTPGHWAWRRPSTAVCADSRIFEPKYRTGTERAGENSIAVNTTEALILQGFRPDYPVAGSTEKAKHTQIGNAVPPPLATALLRQLVDLDQAAHSGERGAPST